MTQQMIVERQKDKYVLKAADLLNRKIPSILMNICLNLIVKHKHFSIAGRLITATVPCCINYLHTDIDAANTFSRNFFSVNNFHHFFVIFWDNRWRRFHFSEKQISQISVVKVLRYNCSL